MKCLPNLDRNAKSTVTSLPQHQIMKKNAVMYKCVNFSEEPLPLIYFIMEAAISSDPLIKCC